MTEEKAKRQFRIGFQTSIITVFVGVVLLVGLTLVYLSFERVTSITRTAASSSAARWLWLPGPAEPYFTPSGFALAAAIKRFA